MKKLTFLITIATFIIIFFTIIILIPLLIFHRSRARADQLMLEDTCVADLNSDVKVNGFVCKSISTPKEADFSTMILATPAAITNNHLGTVVTAADVQALPGLNNLDISMSRIDYAPGGLNPPHVHPRATEMVIVLSGSLDVGFVTTTGKHVSKTVTAGEVFVFPQGLVHYQKNNDAVTPASVIAVLDGQLPGTESLGTTLFAAVPAVNDDVLSKAFQIRAEEMEDIKSGLAHKK